MRIGVIGNVAGDSRDAKAAVMRLVDDPGFDPMTDIAAQTASAARQ